MGGIGGAGGKGGGANQQMIRPPQSMEDLRNYFQQIGPGMLPMDAKWGEQGPYGVLEDGRWGFGQSASGDPLMGFDASGKFFDNSIQAPGSLESIMEGNNIFRSDWYQGLQNQFMPQDPMQPLPTPAPGGGGMGDPYADYRRQAEEASRRAEEEAMRSAGIQDRDLLYGEYLNAANATVDYVTQEIATEQSNAALMGRDYTMNEDIRNQRMQDYFTEIWDKDNQANLENLMEQWGAPEGFEGFELMRREEEESPDTIGVPTTPGNIGPKAGASQSQQVIGGQRSIKGQPAQQKQSVLGGAEAVLGV